MGPLELLTILIADLIEGILGAVIAFLGGLLGVDIDIPDIEA